MENYRVDKSRVYLTGLSCGGIGAWNYLAQAKDSQIVAMVTIAGDGRDAWDAAGCDLGKIPIWAFHGDADPSVPVEGTTETIANLKNCPEGTTKELKETLYPGVDHFSWERTYDMSAGHDIYTWLLGFKRE